MKVFTILLLAAGLIFPYHLQADPVFIGNHSFEFPGSSPNGMLDPANGFIGDWEYTRISAVLPATSVDVTFGSWGSATDGSNAAQLVFLAGVVGSVSIYQDTGSLFLPNSSYTLSFDADQYSCLALLSSASASLYAGQTPVATLSGVSLLDLLDGSGTLRPFSLQFTTTDIVPLGNLGIGFTAGGLAELAGAGFVLDNIRLDVSPAPEPGSAVFLALVGLCLFFARHRASAC